jgi:type VI secretion system protein
MNRRHVEIDRPHRHPGLYRRVLPVVLVLVALSGCSAINSVVAGSRALIGLDPKPVQPDWKSLAISAADDANANSALAVDLVLVKDKAVLDTLITMPASKWFTSRNDLQRTFPEAFTVYQYEMVPTQAVRLDENKFGKERAWAAFVFANYAAPGEHRARLLLNNSGYSVQLNAQSFAVSEIKAGAAQ